MLALTACASSDLPPSDWPPVDFEFEAEQLVLGSEGAQVERRMRVFADGMVVYGTAVDSLRQRVDPVVGPTISLPVFDRLSVYRLVPNALRAFARRLDRLGIATMATRQGESLEVECSVVVLRWRAFGAENRILVQGGVGGPVAELLSAISAHLPTGEQFTSLGREPRAVAPVLRGVPEPLVDRAAALQVHEALCEERADEQLLLDTFSLACANGDRARAQRWLARYGALTKPTAGTAAGSSEVRLDEPFLQRLLPPQ